MYGKLISKLTLIRSVQWNVFFDFSFICFIFWLISILIIIYGRKLRKLITSIETIYVRYSKAPTNALNWREFMYDSSECLRRIFAFATLLPPVEYSYHSFNFQSKSRTSSNGKLMRLYIFNTNTFSDYVN